MTVPAGNSSRPRLRLLHTSDVHLGAYDSSDQSRRDELHGHFRSVIDAAIEERVDLMLIAGDFIDNARVRDETLTYAAEQIARLDRPVLIAPGNHDHVGPNSVYDRIDLTAIAENLTIMRSPSGETVRFDDLDLEVWGRSHTEQDPRYVPFAGMPGRGEAAWQIAIGHGHYIHPKALIHHSFHVYEQELAASGRDYVALGHWEQFTRVAAGETVAAYSGAPDGLSGHTGGRVMLADLMEDGEVCLTARSLGGEPPLTHDEIPLLTGLLPDRGR